MAPVYRIRKSINIKYNWHRALNQAIPEDHLELLSEHAEERIFAMIKEGYLEGELHCIIRCDDDQDIEYSGYWEVYREGTLSCSI